MSRRDRAVPDRGRATPTGTGNGSGTGNAGGATSTGTAGAGNTGTTGTAGTSGTAAGKLDLTGSPKYFRVVRLSNTQWAQAVQTVLGVSSAGMEQHFESPVSGMTAFTNNELVLGFDSRNWQDFQAAAETLAAQVTATDTALAQVLQRHRSGGIDHDALDAGRTVGP